MLCAPEQEPVNAQLTIYGASPKVVARLEYLAKQLNSDLRIRPQISDPVWLRDPELQHRLSTPLSQASNIYKANKAQTGSLRSLDWAGLRNIRDIYTLGSYGLRRAAPGIGPKKIVTIKSFVDQHFPRLPFKGTPGMNYIAELCADLDQVTHLALGSLCGLVLNRSYRQASVHDILTNPVGDVFVQSNLSFLPSSNAQPKRQQAELFAKEFNAARLAIGLQVEADQQA
jgi:hypothetical protein